MASAKKLLPITQISETSSDSDSDIEDDNNDDSDPDRTPPTNPKSQKMNKRLVSLLEERNESIQAHRTEKNILQKQNNHLMKKLASLRHEQQEAIQARDTAVAKNISAKIMLQKQNKKLASLYQLQEAIQARETAISEKNILQKQIEKWQRKVAVALDEPVKILCARIEDYGNALNQVSSLSGIMATELDNRKEQIKSGCVALQVLVDDKKTRCSSLENEREELEQERNNLKQNV